MTESEIVTNELIVEAIDKIVEKFQKKAIKEREKAQRAYVTYKGEIFLQKTILWVHILAMFFPDLRMINYLKN